VAHCKIFNRKNDETPLQTATLIRKSGETTLTLTNAQGVTTEHVRLNTPIADTDLTWVDLTFNYLWWPTVNQLTEADLATRQLKSREGGRNCVVLEVFPPKEISGIYSVLLWIDISTGFVVQTEQTDAHGKAVRKMWIQRIGREEGRWVPREFRIQRDGMRRVTKLIIATIQASTFAVEEQ
ncbi:MAG: outer membrane lipoprotein-sorting protein, partial [Kiritimatiellae bacterium]|nr:outer membrane lipoprotein-sorting protein [Kiritimatiellia bacterium]